MNQTAFLSHLETMVPITLSKAEVLLAKRLAEERQRRDREAGIVDRRFVDREIGFEGVLGEMAASKFLGVAPDRTTHPRRGGWDLKFLGVPCDVKHYPGRVAPVWTVAGHKTAADAVIYIFTCGRMPDEVEAVRIWLAGWLPATMLRRHRQRNVIDNSHARVGWCYRVLPEDLLPVEKLAPLLERALSND